jgi:predicted RNase H-like HicB family nuclease
MRTFLVVIERARRNYSAYSPDLPGCVTTGRTVAEVKRNMKEAIAFHLEGLREDGLEPPRSGALAYRVRIGLPAEAA